MRRAWLAAAILCCVAGPLTAQRAGAGDALFFGASVSRGLARVSCEICRSNRGTAFSGSLRLGGQLRPGVLVGAEADGWLKSEANVDERLWGLSVVASFYPGRGPFYWRGGIGMLLHRIDDDTDVLSTSAFGIKLGLGYEIPLGPRVRVAPELTFFAASPGGSVRLNGAEVFQDADLMLLQLGMSLTRR